MRRYSTTRRAPPAPGRTLDDGEDSAGGRGKWSGAMGYLSRSVFRDRLARIREALGEADLAALVVLTPENFLYVSGYFLDVQPWERPRSTPWSRTRWPRKPCGGSRSTRSRSGSRASPGRTPPAPTGSAATTARSWRQG